MRRTTSVPLQEINCLKRLMVWKCIPELHPSHDKLSRQKQLHINKQSLLQPVTSKFAKCAIFFLFFFVHFQVISMRTHGCTYLYTQYIYPPVLWQHLRHLKQYIIHNHTRKRSKIVLSHHHYMCGRDEVSFALCIEREVLMQNATCW